MFCYSAGSAILTALRHAEVGNGCAHLIYELLLSALIILIQFFPALYLEIFSAFLTPFFIVIASTSASSSAAKQCHE